MCIFVYVYFSASAHSLIRTIIFLTSSCNCFLGCSNPLGMKDGRIKNSQLSSFSHYENDSDWAASVGRLDNSQAWCSNSNDPWREYFQIDLRRVRHVSSMAMQGYRGWSGFFRYSYYVKTFILKYSYDGITWYIYKANDGTELVSIIRTL